jgi:streptomycin 6-kinase
MSIEIPTRLAANCTKASERAAWLGRLPDTLRSLEGKWSLTLGLVYDSENAWVSQVVLDDGTAAVLKLGMPHMEGEHEIEGMLLWNGDPTAQVIKFDADSKAVLLERCIPGTTLHTLPEPDQDIVIAGLLRRLWQFPTQPHPFRSLSTMMQCWSDETLTETNRWPDPGLVRDGLHLFEELPRTASTEVLLATDLHAGNILRSTRKPWLVIDPKPFVGDPAYDATQHLFNCPTRMRSNPHETINRFADLLEVDRERVRLWMFARAAAEPRSRWEDDETVQLARALA